MSGRDAHPQQKKTIMRPYGLAGLCALTLVAAGSVGLAQPAMMAPEIAQVAQAEANRTDAEDKARRGPGPGEIRQDTGLADPSVNPGQARRMKTIEGKVLRHEGDRYVIARPGGKEATVLVDADTTGDKALEPGDHIAATVTPQGRAVTVTKQARE